MHHRSGYFHKQCQVVHQYRASNKVTGLLPYLENIVMCLHRAKLGDAVNINGGVANATEIDCTCETLVGTSTDDETRMLRVHIFVLALSNGLVKPYSCMLH